MRILLLAALFGSSLASAEYAGELVTGLEGASPVVVGNTIFWAALPDGGGGDAGKVVDAGQPDAGKPDAGTSKADAGAVDAGKGGVVFAAPPVVPAVWTKSPDGGVLAPCSLKQTFCFSPEGACDLQVAALIDRATTKLDIIIYSINRPSIVDAILRARARNVPVRIIIDTSQVVEPRELPQLQKLLGAGVAMKRDTHQGIMHMKVVVVNEREFLTGSFNFTNNASENNDENLLIWDCQRNALMYGAKFEQLWAKFKDATEMVMRGTDAGVDAGK